MREEQLSIVDTITYALAKMGEYLNDRSMRYAGLFYSGVFLLVSPLKSTMHMDSLGNKQFKYKLHYDRIITVILYMDYSNIKVTHCL